MIDLLRISSGLTHPVNHSGACTGPGLLATPSPSAHSRLLFVAIKYKAGWKTTPDPISTEMQTSDTLFADVDFLRLSSLRVLSPFTFVQLSAHVYKTQLQVEEKKRVQTHWYSF